jgi:hypothetical protein
VARPVVAALNQANQRPASVAARTLMAIESAGHPYAADPVAPTTEKAHTRESQATAAALLMRSGLIVAAVGDIEAELPACSTVPSAPCRSARRPPCRPTGSRPPSRTPSSSNGRCRRARP